MTTFKRICVRAFELSDSEGNTLKLERGKEYLTSAEKDGKVCVFSTYWVWVGVDLFAGEVRFT